MAVVRIPRKGQMLIERIREYSVVQPTSPALTMGHRSISYGELFTRIKHCAEKLRSCGVGRGDLVLIYTERGLDLVTAMLGVNAAGAAYTVMEQDGDRAEHISRIGEIAPKYSIVSAELVPFAHAAGLSTLSTEILYEDKDASLRDVTVPEEADVAYVLFTSGSTGKSKGVQISWANINHYITAIQDVLNVSRGLSFAHVSSFAADLGNTSLFLALHTGGTLHVLDEITRRNPSAVWSYLTQNNIAFVKTTPSYWRLISQSLPGDRCKIGCLVLGGEPLTNEFARELLVSASYGLLVNHYGPTETTVGVAAYPIRSVNDLRPEAASVPIGKALGRSRLLVRAADGCLRGKAASGELFIGGPSVGVGYHANPHETAKHFFFDPAEMTRFYRSGDLVEIDEDGICTFLGRIDRQVKISGFRVDLDHVESVLRALDGADVVVFAISDEGRQRLIAAISGQRTQEELVALRKLSSRSLQRHMIPSEFLPVGTFPLTSNGKLDRSRLKNTITATLGDRKLRLEQESRPGTADSIEQIRAVWSRLTGKPASAVTANFYDEGGDSLAAIELIAILQQTGLHVDATAFFDNPTLETLLATAIAHQVERHEAEAPIDQGLIRSMSSAQQAFFDAGHRVPDHWNQALLLQASQKIDPTRLRRAVERLCHTHGLLTTAFRCSSAATGPVWVAHALEVNVDAIFKHTEFSARVNIDIDRAVRDIGAAEQARISLDTGRVFSVHLVSTRLGSDLVLLVAHHLCVDVVSWRIIIRELAHLYADPFSFSSSRVSIGDLFWRWTTHIRANAASLQTDLVFWEDTIPNHQRLAITEENTEGTSGTIWFALSPDVTRLIRQTGASSSRGKQLEAALLAAFATAYARMREQATVAIDVESHGRKSFGIRHDPSQAVGWFTSTYPLQIDVRHGSMQLVCDHVLERLAEVPNQGIAYEFHGREKSRLCFNFLGNNAQLYNDLFTAGAESVDLPSARADANNRLYELKLTGRIANERMVVDLSFSRSLMDETEAGNLALAIYQDLQSTCGNEKAACPQVNDLVFETKSRSGLVGYIPDALSVNQSSRDERYFETLLLTGATGFIGIHLLREMLFRTNSKIIALVRGQNEVVARHRLTSVWDHYFRAKDLDDFRDRLVVLAGDCAEPELGVEGRIFAELCLTVDAVYHLAADTRLVGTKQSFRRQNVFAVETLIALCRGGRRKSIHYVSTLSVAGRVDKADRVEFCEDDLDIGQSFLGAYEESKYLAEVALRAYARSGGDVFVYRTGNVTGRSDDAVFQRNSGDNRFVQFLAGVAEAGALPRNVSGGIVLSYVDVVAAGILVLSRSASVQPGTYHLDSGKETAYTEFFLAMRKCGIALPQSDAVDFAELFAEEPARGISRLLASFWWARPERNVRLECSRTLQILGTIGIRFPAVTRPWLEALVRGLQQANTLPDGVNRRSKPLSAEIMRDTK